MEADKLMQDKAPEMALPRCGGAHLELKMDDKWSVLDAMERPWMMVVQPGASRIGASTATRLCSSCTPATASASCALTT